tara:strand:+ start:698 stop:838 length:141 start_codon:yes stop_codon:yes gene_type:complete
MALFLTWLLAAAVREADRNLRSAIPGCCARLLRLAERGAIVKAQLD